jgi:ketosteroid isomerase-like protein
MAPRNEQIVRQAYQVAEDMPGGTLAPTGNRMDAPCCDVFELAGGKIRRFDCHPSGTVTLTQLGLIGNLSATLVR